MKSVKGVTLVASALLAGCVNLAPEYQRPEVTSLDPQLENLIGDQVGQSSAELDWRQFMVDPKLQQLIELGLGHNRDLQVAYYTLVRAQAQYGVQRTGNLPNIDLRAGASNQLLPEALNGTETISRQYNVDLGILSYELDFFSRIDNLEQQALFSYLGTEQGRRNTQITVMAQIATTYLSLAANRSLLTLAEETLLSQLESLSLTQQSFDNGVVSGLDVAQAEVTVANAQVDLARFRNQIAADRHQLAQLVGVPVSEALMPEAIQAQSLAPLMAGLPSALLLNRPDLLQAEYALMAENANIGAARANYFPTISLTATAGLLSGDLDDLFSSDARSWNFSPSLTLPIFNWNEIGANVDIAKANRDIAVASYQGAIQSAFREVADALAARAFLAEQYQAQQALVAATGKSFELSDLRFRQGVDSFYNALDSQRSFFAAQQQLISLQLSQQTNLVTLFRALGGGWVGTPAPELEVEELLVRPQPSE
ncbi:efflux transporter outer membrane subunit [Ferrimonas senticii]|uniref:efflux transporter outer membrane subunit n=1 Tax=Ferrimonas senticii TaxID=394566 RepID=UPI00040F75C7|nr:efflux transporter outer membrane subunit [Ferrimonas senticii]